ncbi:EF-hand domain-containing protein [uncultured Paludibaculum sp.]|uniref:EF-hand domain-containing protein n=1 Tax=uncultured Paludibaculum sp. TaxID=1765020 RepID=UPI002AAB3D91|nr:EF-hand domain-containing protein [uncultured Paludibaculum sp.]
MLRSLYIQLLRLHPSAFRMRYGDEMLSIYDEASRSGRPWPLFGDACVSLGRQWLLRENEPEPQPAPLASSDGVPVFYCADQSMPPKSALLNGGLVALAAFALVGFALGHGQGRRPWNTTFSGSNRAVAGSPGFGVEGGQSAIAFGGGASGGGSSTRSEVGTDSVWVRILRFYENAFSKPRPPAPREATAASWTPAPPPAAAAARSGQSTVYLALSPRTFDTNHDGVVSAEEMADAGSALSRLDSNGDGRLTAEDYFRPVSAPAAPSAANGHGVQTPARDPVRSQDLQSRAERSLYPTRTAAEYGILRQTSEGAVSVETMQTAEAADPNGALVRLHPLLQALDTNHDGEISPEEMRNAPAVLRKLDKNHDGRITSDEWPLAPVITTKMR